MESLQVFVRVPSSESKRAVDASVNMSSSGYSGGETSDEQETLASPAPPSAVGSKRKKTSYNMQKAEIARLKDEANALERKLQRLDAKRPATIAREHLQLQSHVRANALLVAGAKSLVSSVKDDEPPVGTFIHLPVEELDRQRIFHAFKPHQIEDATAYMLARCQFTDLTRASRQTELFTSAAGDQVAVLWEVIRITEGEPSVRCVFDEMLSFSRIREMAIAERTGRLDIRESDVDADPTDVAQSRILTDHKSGLLIEKNVVVHSHYFPPKTRDDKPYAVYVIDSVDQDDAYPYRPHERVRQDGVSVMLMLETPGSGTETIPRSVAIVKYAFVRVRKSALASDATLTELADDGLRSCFGVMVKIVRERLAARGPRASVMEEPAPEAWSATHDETDFLMSILEGENMNGQQPHHYSM